MRNVICCWVHRDYDNFERHVPIRFSGNRNLRLGFTNEIDLLFLSGYGLLGEKYQTELRNLGYHLHDVGDLYSRIAASYPQLNRFGDYEKKCFLRWLVIHEYFSGEPIIHYDGDIIFNENPAVIAKLLHGRTFVLQGCPALTTISDQAWFSQYGEQLGVFANDIEGYSAKAWAERVGWEISQREKWAGSRFREIISSDQDFLSHLVHTNKITQDKPSQILPKLGSYMVFESPLYINSYENNLRGAVYIRNADLDYIDSRRVLLWHMHSCFTNYLGKFIFRKQFLARRYVNRISNDAEKKDLDSYLYTLYVRYLRGKTHYRLNVYRYFFEEHDFGEVMNSSSWWQPGVFA